MKTINIGILLLFFVSHVFADEVAPTQQDVPAWYFAAEFCFLSPNSFEGGPKNGGSFSVSGYSQQFQTELLVREYKQVYESDMNTSFKQIAQELHLRRYFQNRPLGFHVDAIARYAEAKGAVLLSPTAANFRNPPYRYQTDRKLAFGFGFGWRGIFGEHFIYGTSLVIANYLTQVDDTSLYIAESYQNAKKGFDYLEILNIGFMM